MNLSLRDISGEMLIVSQFTLYGDTRKGKSSILCGSSQDRKGGDVVSMFHRKLPQ